MNIAAAHDRDVFGNFQSRFSDGIHGPDCGWVVRREDRRWEVSITDPFFHGAITIHFGKTALANQIGIESQVMLRQSLFIAGKAQRSVRCYRSIQVSHPAMAEA